MEQVYSPLNYYLQGAKKRHADLTLARYEELEKKSGVSPSENAVAVKKYDEQIAKVENVAKAIRGKRTLRTLGIVFAVLFVVVGLVLAQNVHPAWYACTPVAIAFIIFVCVTLNKSISALKAEHFALSTKAQELYDNARAQTAPLCALFLDDEAKTLVERAVPCLSFDEEFCAERLDKMTKDFGYTLSHSSEESVTDTLSGELCNHPFLYDRRLVHRMGTCTYHGSLTISWTTRERNSQGQYETRTHTETLQASVTRPKPYYDYITELIYCHEGAPELSFSRTYAHAERENEKSLEKKILKGEKKLLKLTDESLKNGGDFISTFNTEFEVLFNATDRSDEIDFRTMFTAKAQDSMVKLLLSRDGYGDDFTFEKRGQINRICSEHSQFRPLNLRAEHYYSHDLKEIKRLFLTRNEEFFKGTFFDFAPLLLIPTYQTAFSKNVAFYNGTRTTANREELVNRVPSLFEPPEAKMPSVLKTALQNKDGDDEIITVYASSYTTIERTDYIPKRGGDGNVHNVPVSWTEYIPISQQTPARLTKSGEVVVL